ncbi:DUF2254 family protein [Nocardia rhizosphaerihabitans]|uniref:DUF2254 domain-containing protein n=1 Tax=Nocardia rhizosphaerihabitans TaxID=1691570 RepID=A0ABQ2KGX8_9NOCA|nr:DUF2254 family protein [Nocardia rhizosphaerihabitans]GGN82808.1 hypothetical protein GCM10011610_34590 [Nocardia rhizosphaerihabitans]
MAVLARVVRTRRVRAGLAQLVFVFVGLGAGFAVTRIAWGPRVASAQVIDTLLAIGLGVLGAVAVIFSLLFLVVQWVTTAFTPRLMLFRDDPIVWRTFGFALGLAVFCVTAALAIGKQPEVSAGVPLLAMVLVLVQIALLRTLQLRAFSAIQLAPALGAIAARGRKVLGAAYPEHGEVSPARSPLLPPHMSVVWQHPPMVLQRVEVDRLIDVATAANAVIVVWQSPGATLHRGSRVADVYGGKLSEASVLQGLIVGNERTFDQDPLLAFRLLADIALRAVSSAVNDPATAVQAFDELGDLLGSVAATRLDPLRRTDHNGVERLVIDLPGWEEFLRTGVDDIMYAANAPMVVTALRDMLRRVRDRADPDRTELIDQRLTWLDDRVTERNLT